MKLQGKEQAVVVENGRPVSAHPTEAQAIQEAAKRKQVLESQGQQAPKVETKQQLLG